LCPIRPGQPGRNAGDQRIGEDGIWTSPPKFLPTGPGRRVQLAADLQQKFYENHHPENDDLGWLKAAIDALSVYDRLGRSVPWDGD
jgi:hypothetical protein